MNQRQVSLNTPTMIAAISLSLLGCKLAIKPSNDLKSLEAISGLSTKTSCKIGKNLASTLPPKFIGQASNLESPQLSAWSAIVAALPPRIRSAAQNGELQLSQKNQCKNSPNKSMALEVDPGCFQFQVDARGTPTGAQISGLSSAEEILAHGIRLLTLAFLNYEQRLYLAGIGDRTLQEGLIKESAQIAIAFLKDLEVLHKNGRVTKERLKLIGEEIRTSPQFYSAIIAAHAVESMSCGELGSVASRFPEVVARYQRRSESPSLGQILEKDIKSGFALNDFADEPTFVSPSGNEPYGPQTPSEAKETILKRDPKAKGDVFQGSASSDFSTSKGRDSSVIPNMSLKIGNAVVEDPRSGRTTNKEEVLSEAKRLNWPYPAVKTLESFVDSAANAKENHQTYKARIESNYYDRTKEHGGSTDSREIDRGFDYLLNSGAYIRGFVPLTDWMNGREMYGTGEDGKMRKYIGNSELP